MAKSQNILTITDASFETEILKSNMLTIVDFWAEWCGPCKMLAPILDAIADEYAGKTKICKINVDDNPSTPPKYSIRGIPMLIFFKNGQPVDQMVGNQPKDAIIQTIKKHL